MRPMLAGCALAIGLLGQSGLAQQAPDRAGSQDVIPADFIGEITYTGTYEAYALSADARSWQRITSSPSSGRRGLGSKSVGNFTITIRYEGASITGTIQTRAHSARSDGWSWPQTFSGTRRGDICTIPRLLPTAAPVQTKCDRKQFSYEAARYPGGNDYILSSFVQAKAPETRDFVAPDPTGRISRLVNIYPGMKEIHEGPWIKTGAEPGRRSIQFYGVCGAGQDSCKDSLDKEMLGFAFYDTLTDRYAAGFYIGAGQMRFCGEGSSNCIDYTLISGSGATPWTRNVLGSLSYMQMFHTVTGAMNRINRIPASQSILSKCLRFTSESKTYVTPYYDRNGFKVKDERSTETYDEVSNTCSEKIIIDVDDCLLLGDDFPFTLWPNSSRQILPMAASCRFYQLSKKWPE